MRKIVLALAAAALVAPGFAQEATEAKLSGAALIDHWIKAKWDDAGLRPAKRADDAEFLRRAYLDIVGRIPSLDEAEKFLADKAMYKRQKLVEALVKDARYSEHWADLWSGILVGFDNDNREQATRMKATADLRGMLSRNLPHDEFARKVIAAQGAVAQRGAMPVEESGLAGYLYNIQREAGRDFPMALAGKLTRAFMGVQIQCAQCHDHPFDKWTQEEFYGMASFFTEVSVRRVPIGADMMERKKDAKKEEKKGEAPRKPEPPKVQQQPEYYFQVSDNPRRGGRGADLSIPDSKTSAGPIKASFIETGKGAVAGELRRVTFAKYVTGKENLQFAKMSVNRMWAHFMGAGIVNPVDDFNGKNKPTHPELLEALARDFIGHQYDNHWLIKAITSSAAYHLTSRVAGKERDPQAEKYFAIARVRAMAPEQILRSVMEAVDFGEGPLARMRARDGKEGGKGPMAGMDRKDMALFGMLSQFRSNFADDEGNEVTEFAGTIPSALLMMNGGLTNSGNPFGGFGGGRLDPKMAARMADRMGAMSPLGDLVKKHPGPEAAIRAIYLSVLTRPPTDKETKRWKEHVARSQGLAGYEDLQWTLLNTSEFLFNH